MKEEETTGLMVMVSPDLLTSDHVNKIGKIESANFTEDEIWVRFEDEEVDCFSPETLFVLKSADELNKMVETHRTFFWAHVIKNLQSLALLRVSGSESDLKSAFTCLQNDPGLQSIATIQLNEIVDYAPRRKIGR
ncbi:MAG: hypothetical protein JWR09_1870 [Mucilaginibacter sp.]|nr:hypothetical protein [Mucilaginibacter sp.]